MLLDVSKLYFWTELICPEERLQESRVPVWNALNWRSMLPFFQPNKTKQNNTRTPASEAAELC